MRSSTSTKQGDILNTQNNVDETPKQECLIKNEAIEGTPFRIIGQEEIWFLTMGNHKVTENANTEEEALMKLVHEHWLITMRMIARIVEIITEEKKGDE